MPRVPLCRLIKKSTAIVTRQSVVLVFFLIRQFFYIRVDGQAIACLKLSLLDYLNPRNQETTPVTLREWRKVIMGNINT